MILHPGLVFHRRLNSVILRLHLCFSACYIATDAFSLYVRVLGSVPVEVPINAVLILHNINKSITYYPIFQGWG